MGDSWAEIAVDYSVHRRDHAHDGVTSTQTGYSEDALDEMWTGARAHFEMCYYNGPWRRRTRSTWRPKHNFCMFLMYIHMSPPPTTAWTRSGRRKSTG